MGRVREALFSMLEARGVNWPNARVLDLYAGSGSLGLEALSRGAAFACFVESAPYAAKVIAANTELLGVDRERFAIHQAESAQFLAGRPALPFSVVFIDPPYTMDVIGPTFSALLNNRWVLPGAVINAEVETRRRFDPQTVHPGGDVLADRTYGQTRVILWNVNQQ